MRPRWRRTRGPEAAEKSWKVGLDGGGSIEFGVAGQIWVSVPDDPGVEREVMRLLMTTLASVTGNTGRPLCRTGGGNVGLVYVVGWQTNGYMGGPAEWDVKVNELVGALRRGRDARNPGLGVRRRWRRV